MHVPFLDLRISDLSEKQMIREVIDRVLDHGRLVMGPEIDAFELLVASRLEREYCVSVGSGTDALYLGMRALGIGPGDEVITTSMSWIATANAIALTGATPVFADIRTDLNIDPASIERLITKSSRAILFVNYTGRMCDISALESIASNNNLFLIEDASQSFGASSKGYKSGSCGDLSAMSHNPMKVFAAIGEAGSILTNSGQAHERLVSLRYNGTVNRETCIEPSLNGRMDTIQAAILIERLKTVDNLIAKRRANAAFYNSNLAGYVSLPPCEESSGDVYYTYTIRSNRRDDLREHLESRGIETKIQHPLLMPQQPAYLGSAGEWSRASVLVNQVLCIPVHEKLNQEELAHVVSCIVEFGDSIPLEDR